VLSPEQFKSLHNKLKIEKLIVASILDNPKSKSDVLEFCIAEGIDIQKIPESEILMGKNISLNQFYSLTLGGCLLLHTIGDSNYFNLLPLKFQGRVTVFYESFQITYNGICYQGE
jgi:hypothetical protein